jgi:primary-amine oxidase
MGVSSDSPVAKARVTSGTNGTNGGVNGVNNSSSAPTTHPLGPLTAEEISRSSRLVAQSWPEGTLFRFKVIKLREPTKTELLSYLDAKRAGTDLPAIDRLSDVAYYIKNTVRTLPPCRVLPSTTDVMAARINSTKLL